MGSCAEKTTRHDAATKLPSIPAQRRTVAKRSRTKWKLMRRACGCCVRRQQSLVSIGCEPVKDSLSDIDQMEASVDLSMNMMHSLQCLKGKHFVLEDRRIASYVPSVTERFLNGGLHSPEETPDLSLDEAGENRSIQSNLLDANTSDPKPVVNTVNVDDEPPQKSTESHTIDEGLSVSSSKSSKRKYPSSASNNDLDDDVESGYYDSCLNNRKIASSSAFSFKNCKVHPLSKSYQALLMSSSTIPATRRLRHSLTEYTNQESLKRLSLTLNDHLKTITESLTTSSNSDIQNAKRKTHHETIIISSNIHCPEIIPLKLLPNKIPEMNLKPAKGLLANLVCGKNNFLELLNFEALIFAARYGNRYSQRFVMILQDCGSYTEDSWSSVSRKPPVARFKGKRKNSIPPPSDISEQFRQFVIANYTDSVCQNLLSDHGNSPEAKSQRKIVREDYVPSSIFEWHETKQDDRGFQLCTLNYNDKRQLQMNSTSLSCCFKPETPMPSKRLNEEFCKRPRIWPPEQVIWSICSQVNLLVLSGHGHCTEWKPSLHLVEMTLVAAMNDAQKSLYKRCIHLMCKGGAISDDSITCLQSGIARSIIVLFTHVLLRFLESQPVLGEDSVEPMVAGVLIVLLSAIKQRNAKHYLYEDVELIATIDSEEDMQEMEYRLADILHSYQQQTMSDNAQQPTTDVLQIRRDSTATVTSGHSGDSGNATDKHHYDGGWNARDMYQLLYSCLFHEELAKMIQQGTVCRIDRGVLNAIDLAVQRQCGVSSRHSTTRSMTRRRIGQQDQLIVDKNKDESALISSCSSLCYDQLEQSAIVVQNYIKQIRTNHKPILDHCIWSSYLHHALPFLSGMLSISSSLF